MEETITEWWWPSPFPPSFVNLMTVGSARLFPFPQSTEKGDKSETHFLALHTHSVPSQEFISFLNPIILRAASKTVSKSGTTERLLRGGGGLGTTFQPLRSRLTRLSTQQKNLSRPNEERNTAEPSIVPIDVNQ